MGLYVVWISEPNGNYSLHAMRWSERMDIMNWDDDQLKRKRMVEGGYSVVANMRSDTALIEWAKGNGKFVRIDRRTKWGNPFVIGKDGDRKTVVEEYDMWLMENSELRRQIMELDGKVLGCWCYPEECHGEILCLELYRRKNKSGPHFGKDY